MCRIWNLESIHWIFLTFFTIFDLGHCVCSPTIYILPLYVTTTVDEEFERVFNFFTRCQQKSEENHNHNQLVVLSLDHNDDWIRCRAGDECVKKFENNLTRSDIQKMIIKGKNTSYELSRFFRARLTGKCLERSVLLIPTNIQCSRVCEYPFFWDFIGKLENDASNYLDAQKLHTHIIWLNYNHITYIDVVGCELEHLLKPRGSRVTTLTSNKNSEYLSEMTALSYCSHLPMKKPAVGGIVVALIVVCVVLCFLIVVICSILLFRFQKRRSTPPRNVKEWVEQQETKY